MKKIIAILCVLAIALGVAGCGAKKENTVINQPSSTNEDVNTKVDKKGFTEAEIKAAVEKMIKTHSMNAVAPYFLPHAQEFIAFCKSQGDDVSVFADVCAQSNDLLSSLDAEDVVLGANTVIELRQYSPNDATKEFCEKAKTEINDYMKSISATSEAGVDAVYTIDYELSDEVSENGFQVGISVIVATVGNAKYIVAFDS